MKKIWNFIKNCLKRILPPTVHILHREVQDIQAAMAAREANLSRQIGEVKNELRMQADRLERERRKQEEAQGKRLERLTELFASANRENLRLFFDAREERRAMDERYAQLAGEMEKLRDNQAELEKKLSDAERRLAEGQTASEKRLAEGQSAAEKHFAERQVATEKKLIEGQITSEKKLAEENALLRAAVDTVRRAAEEGVRYASESVWAEVFDHTITNSTWLKDKTFSPGRWAVGYPYLYVMYRVLNEKKPKRILELGLGQSTRMIAQYASAHEGVEHYVVEHDPAWIEFFCRDYSLPPATKIIQLDWDFVPFREADAVRVYKDFGKTFSGEKFDFISVDAPLGGDMKEYARIDVLQLMPDCLAESFVVMMDDINRYGEKRTVSRMKEVLSDNGVAFADGWYWGNKALAILTSPDNGFLTTM